MHKNLTTGPSSTKLSASPWPREKLWPSQKKNNTTHLTRKKSEQITVEHCWRTETTAREPCFSHVCEKNPQTGVKPWPDTKHLALRSAKGPVKSAVDRALRRPWTGRRGRKLAPLRGRHSLGGSVKTLIINAGDITFGAKQYNMDEGTEGPHGGWGVYSRVGII